jgi:hypothetical protein
LEICALNCFEAVVNIQDSAEMVYRFAMCTSADGALSREWRILGDYGAIGGRGRVMDDLLRIGLARDERFDEGTVHGMQLHLPNAGSHRLASKFVAKRKLTAFKGQHTLTVRLSRGIKPSGHRTVENGSCQAAWGGGQEVDQPLSVIWHARNASQHDLGNGRRDLTVRRGELSHVERVATCEAGTSAASRPGTIAVIVSTTVVQAGSARPH